MNDFKAYNPNGCPWGFKLEMELSCKNYFRSIMLVAMCMVEEGKKNQFTDETRLLDRQMVKGKATEDGIFNIHKNSYKLQTTDRSDNKKNLIFFFHVNLYVIIIQRGRNY